MVSLVSNVARCPASGSIRKALSRAIAAVKMEYFPSGCSFSHTFRSGDCSSLRAQFEQRKLLVLSEVVSERSSRSVASALKSCHRLFDVACEPCDKVASRRARSKWMLGVNPLESIPCPSSPTSWSRDPLAELVRRVERLVDGEWGRKLSLYRDRVRVPDQNGCFETPKGEGGTLATRPGRHRSPYDLRVGTAKTKGKVRVVTMQTSRVKDVLGPLHDCLYDFISRRKWLVRGDLTLDHVRSLRDDLRPGEDFVSGDYMSATDNVFTPVAFAIVRTLAKSRYLTEEERELLLGSFDPATLHWVSRSGVHHPIRRGSMMGNLMSFPILCILNRACMSIARSLGPRDPSCGSRVTLINGDDIAFCGTRRLYDDWRMVTSAFGLVVNEEKTGVSSRWIELNSRSYDSLSDSFVRKPVLSFFGPRQKPGCTLSDIASGVGCWSKSTLLYCVSLLRREIVRTGVCLDSVPRWLAKSLLRRRWFRCALSSSPETTRKGVMRAYPSVMKDCAPVANLVPLFDQACSQLLRHGVRLARGVKVVPFSEDLPAISPVLRAPRGHICIRRPRWMWIWPEPVWRWWSTNSLPIRSMEGRWFDDHPALKSATSWRVLPSFFPPSQSLLLTALRPDGVNWV